MRIARAPGAAGLTLVEVLAALLLLATVLVTVAGSLTLGAARLRDGARRTRALSVGHAMLEEMETWSHRGLYRRFGLDGSAGQYRVDTRANPAARRWQRLLDRDLHGARAEILLQAADPIPPAKLAEARTIRVRVTVYWDDRGRSRSVSLVTVRG